MSRTWCAPVLAGALALGIVVGARSLSGHSQQAFPRVLDEHPSIQYAVRPTTDRIAKLNEALARGTRSLRRDRRTGYLLPVLDALGISAQSQLLVFSKTGVQRAYINPHNPRALYYDHSVAVGYVPGAPELELAAHDPRQGVVFYTLNQDAARPVFTRQTTCLSCHVSASTLNVPGMIARNNGVGDDGNVLPQFGNNDVDHRTPHPDRWGGYFVTSEGVPAPYAQRAHSGNITFSGRGNTSSQVFVDWINSSPETRGYLSAFSDIVALLAFDHQVHAINLLTRLNWEGRVAPAAGDSAEVNQTLRGLINEVADYLLFVGEVPPSVSLTPHPGFAEYLESKAPKDRRGRSCAQLDLERRLFRYPCSYMLYTDAFEALAPSVKTAIYRRIADILSGTDAHPRYTRLAAEDRRAVMEILSDTKRGFPGH